MSNKGGGVAILGLVFILVPVLAWLGNAYKFTQCDFESNYRCEAIHTIGFLPYVSLVTVWFGTDEEEESE